MFAKMASSADQAVRNAYARLAKAKEVADQGLILSGVVVSLRPYGSRVFEIRGDMPANRADHPPKRLTDRPPTCLRTELHLIRTDSISIGTRKSCRGQ